MPFLKPGFDIYNHLAMYEENDTWRGFALNPTMR